MSSFRKILQKCPPACTLGNDLDAVFHEESLSERRIGLYNFQVPVILKFGHHREVCYWGQTMLSELGKSLQRTD